MKITREYFGTTSSGQEISKYTMDNGGLNASFINFGARLISLTLKNEAGKPTDIVVGYDNINDFESYPSCYGACVGRVANRIADGTFDLNGKTYNLLKNNNGNALHGGEIGFQNCIFEGKVLPDGVKFTYVSKDGESGFPGTLDFSVTYKLTNAGELRIIYNADTDQDTLINVTNHTYFNLNGEGRGNVLDNILQMHCEEMTEVREGLIPTGKIVKCQGVFDWREGKPLGENLDCEDEQLAIAGTHDHNYIIPGTGLRECAKLTSPVSGITMETYTDQPGVQIYIPQNTNENPAKKGHIYGPHTSVCIETQHYPDSIHHDNFPSVVLKAGEHFVSETDYRFTVNKKTPVRD